MKKTSVLILLIIGVFIFLTSAVSSFAQTQSGQANPPSTQQPRSNQVQPTAIPQSQNTNPQQGVNPKNLPMNTESDVPQNLSTYTQGVFIEMISASTCLLSGMDAIRPNQPCLGFDPETQKLGYVESQQSGGILGLMGGLIASTYNVPASSGQYVRHVAGNFGITQDTIAQTNINPGPCIENPELCSEGDREDSGGLGTGRGFEGLQPILGVWETMRNIVYLVFVLVFIVLGLGIMFRIQIDPRAVMTIQSQLPKIVIALILVTFSYAIAGFLVDMMYLSLFLIINVFQGQGLEISTSLATNPINATNELGGIGGMSFDAAKGVTGVMNSLFDGTYGTLLRGAINTIVGALIGGVVGGPFSALAGVAVGGIGGNLIGFIPGIGSPFTLIVGAIAWIIIVIAILVALFRLWFTLLKTFIFLLINITFAPFWIVLGLFPGSSLSFGTWLRSIVSDLAAFPVVLVLFSLGKTIQDGITESTQPPFVPPFVGDPGEHSAFASLIGIGIILLAPEAVNITKSALKSPEFKYGGTIAGQIGAGTKLAQIPPRAVWGKLTSQDPYDAQKGGPIATWAAKGKGTRHKVARALFNIREA